MEVCRLCLYSNKEHLNMISLQNEIIIKMKNNLQIEVTESDALPNYVCNYCVQRINEWCTFKDNCLKTTQLLVEINNQKRKNEDSFLTFNKLPLSEVGQLDEKPSLDKDFLYTCDICKAVFVNCLDLIEHQNIHDGEPVFKCDQCSEVFSFRAQLVEHDHNHKEKCPECEKLISKSSLKTHLKKHSAEYKCDQCSVVCYCKFTLEQHRLTKHVNQKKYICEKCSKTFASKSLLKVHLKTHSDDKSYNCKMCTYRCKTAAALYIHKSVHSSEICICEFCSKEFKSRRNLNDHLRRVHTAGKNHSCNFCSKKFVDKCMLNVHERTHTGVRPYACDQCGKAFVRSDGLKEHIKIHSNRLEYNCEKCLKQYTAKTSLRRHKCDLIEINTCK